MSFWAETITSAAPVSYEPPPDYLLTVRFASLEPASGEGALYVTTEHVDGKKKKALVGIMRPHKASETLRLDLTLGFGTEVEFSVEPIGAAGKPGPSVSLVGFIHPLAALQLSGRDEDEDYEDEEGSDDDDEEEEEEDGDSDEEEDDEGGMAAPQAKLPMIVREPAAIVSSLCPSIS